MLNVTSCSTKFSNRLVLSHIKFPNDLDPSQMPRNTFRSLKSLRLEFKKIFCWIFCSEIIKMPGEKMMQLQKLSKAKISLQRLVNFVIYKYNFCSIKGNFHVSFTSVTCVFTYVSFVFTSVTCVFTCVAIVFKHVFFLYRCNFCFYKCNFCFYRCNLFLQV